MIIFDSLKRRINEEFPGDVKWETPQNGSISGVPFAVTTEEAMNNMSASQVDALIGSMISTIRAELSAAKA